MQKKAVFVQSLVPIRSEPAHRNEMVSQGLFGESCVVLEQQAEWYKIKMQYDDYEGWAAAGQIAILAAAAPLSDTTIVQGCKAAYLWRKETLNYQKKIRIYLEAGAELPNSVLSKNTFCINETEYEYKNRPTNSKTVVVPSSSNTAAKILQTARYFLGTPYLWGGRSRWGIDCSGLVQICHKLHHIALPRDAWQQAQIGERVEHLKEAQTADLAFFHNAQQRIVHVGILWNKKQIIHASNEVRIDTIDEKGIFNATLQRYTHTLAHIQRLIYH